MKVVEEAIEKEKAILGQIKGQEYKLQRLVEEAIAVRVGALLQAVGHYGHFQVEPSFYGDYDGAGFSGGELKIEGGDIIKLTDLLLSNDKTAHFSQEVAYDDSTLNYIMSPYEDLLLFLKNLEEIKFTVTENEVILRGDEA